MSRSNGSWRTRAFARQGAIERYLADANVFMEFSGIVTVAWQWLKQAIVASQALKAGDFSRQIPEFYESKIVTMKYFFKYELPKSLALSDTLMQAEDLTIWKAMEILL